MKQQRTWTLLALSALMLCSACGNQQTKTATFIMPTSQQVETVKWDEAVAASTMVRVSNASLISMR